MFEKLPLICNIVLKVTQDKIIHLLCAFFASPYPPGLKQSILQPKKFVNFRCVDWHIYRNTKSETGRKMYFYKRQSGPVLIRKWQLNLNAFESVSLSIQLFKSLQALWWSVCKSYWSHVMGKTCFCYMRTLKAQISLRTRAV